MRPEIGSNVYLNVSITKYIMSSPAFNKKLQDILISQSEETKQVPRPHSDMIRIIELQIENLKQLWLICGVINLMSKQYKRTDGWHRQKDENY